MLEIRQKKHVWGLFITNDDHDVETCSQDGQRSGTAGNMASARLSGSQGPALQDYKYGI